MATKNTLVKQYERLMETKRKADLNVASAQARVESAEKAAEGVRAKVAAYDKTPKELRDWAEAEEKALTAELAKLEGTVDESQSSELDI